jgi:hypothetical protein
MSLNIDFCTCEPSNAETRMLKEPVTGSRAHPNLKSFTLPIQQNSFYADWVEAMVLEDFFAFLHPSRDSLRLRVTQSARAIVTG